MRILTILLVFFVIAAHGQEQPEIEVIKQQVGPEIHLVAINNSDEAYVVSFDVESYGMDLSRSVPAELLAKPQSRTTLIKLTPIPGQRWSYRQSFSYELAPMEQLEEQQQQDPHFMDEWPAEDPDNKLDEPADEKPDPTDDMENVKYIPREYRTNNEARVEPKVEEDEPEQQIPVVDERVNRSPVSRNITTVYRSEYIPSEVSDQYGLDPRPGNQISHKERELPLSMAFLSNQYIPGSVKLEALKNRKSSELPSEVKGDIRDMSKKTPDRAPSTPKNESRVLGLRTVTYQVPDLSAAKKWYSEAFKAIPYFDEPFYVGFNIGGYELGLQLSDQENTGQVDHLTYWGVEDVEQSFRHFLKAGASIHEEPSDVGGGIIVASVRDPWGNVIGLIYNPHFKAE